LEKATERKKNKEIVKGGTNRPKKASKAGGGKGKKKEKI